MTPILKVLTEYCAVYVDDIRLKEKYAESLPLFAREMWGYFKPAIALFTLPSGMQEFLVGTDSAPKLTEPLYDNTQYTVETQQNDSFEVSLGESYAGYELCSCRIKSTDSAGYTKYMPIQVTYDSDTAVATVYVDEQYPLPAGTVLDFDFYTDGYFSNTLSGTAMNILGKCFQVVWQSRFNTDWLSMVPKIDDKSFTEQNRASKMNADTERIRQLLNDLAGEMRRYEQNVFHSHYVHTRMPLI